MLRHESKKQSFLSLVDFVDLARISHDGIKESG